jgi:hypothetical protein
MSPKILSTIAAALILTLGGLTTHAVAGTAAHARGGHHAVRAHPHTTLSGAYHAARRDVAPRAGYAVGTRTSSAFGPGYVFVPGHGILGEDCDMPTSTCPNELRDTQ